jgi:hypothetical protein
VSCIPEFVKGVMKKVAEMLLIKQKQGPPYTPQVNGNSEAKNPTVETNLRILSNLYKADWADMLQFVEYVIENTINTATGVTPKFFNTGFDKVDPLVNPFATPPVGSEEAQTWGMWHDALMTARELAGQHLAVHQEVMKRVYNDGKSPHTFKVGDKVMVWFPRHNKLDLTWHGPYIIEQFNDDIAGGSPSENPRTVIVYHEEQPSCKELFHVDRLKPFAEVPKDVLENAEMLAFREAFRAARVKSEVPQEEFEEVPVDVDLRDVMELEEDEFVVEKIVAHRDVAVPGKRKKRGKKGKKKETRREYKVRWDGYPPSADTWEDGDKLGETCGELVYEYCREKGLDGVQ